MDHRARDALTRVVLNDTEEPDYWKRSVDAVSAMDGGASWASALDETRSVLGRTLFDDGVEIARGELHRWLERAPQLVGRVVAAAVAREASGVAGRAVAARAAAESLSHGGSEEDAIVAAGRAIDDIVTALADSSVELAFELAALNHDVDVPMPSRAS